MAIFKNIQNIMLVSLIGGSSLGILPLQTHAAQETTKSERIQKDMQLVSFNGGDSPQLGINNPESPVNKWELTVFTDTLQIKKQVNAVLQNTVFQNITRELTDSTFDIVSNRYNVMMFTAHSNYQHSLQGKKFYARLNFRGNEYDLYVFEKGEFYKDALIVNKPWSWAYRGWATESDTTSSIQFRLPS
ncbi:hypothetical protein [Bacillus sp. FDAARGOS_1420]|uniref:hypothetical protein n=1 Tax=Bacillus sp. FDAARGOS_1420 TaxID=2856338 RepID=UPI001C5AFD3F|nr:hypothetical protein [Bacillus sp. FDAARGOS_1420]MBW3496706.1 hypothetical protein [Bacillus sp. FDAARGOS_1420]